MKDNNHENSKSINITTNIEKIIREKEKIYAIVVELHHLMECLEEIISVEKEYENNTYGLDNIL